MKAIWNGQVLAESNETIVIENNHYFPPLSLNLKYFIESETTTMCSWKGAAGYYSLVVNDETNIDAAWYYRSPKEAASEIRDYVAFWKGVAITE